MKKKKSFTIESIQRNLENLSYLSQADRVELKTLKITLKNSFEENEKLREENVNLKETNLLLQQKVYRLMQKTKILEHIPGG